MMKFQFLYRWKILRSNQSRNSPKPVVQQQPKVETAKVTKPLIVPDDEVKPEDEVKPVDALENARIGTIDQKGIQADDVTAPPVEASTGVVDAPKVKKDIDEVFTIVQRQAQYPGGTAEWLRYLERNLNRDLPSANGAPPADYTVTVSFIVDRQGNVSDVRAENDPGYGTREEAIRVIRKGPKWIPAEQNGHAVVYRQKQNITFRITAD